MTITMAAAYQGFMVKVVSSKYNTEHWNLEEETLMIANQAGLYFSVAWRVFYGFGLAVCPIRHAGAHLSCICIFAVDVV